MQKFSCYLIGKDNLLIECCKILLSSGNKILGIFSESPQIKQWSNENQIILFETFSEFESNVIQKKADYLFSIINDRVLNNKLIESARRFSINYHDSLLPTYAGVHATSWALLNGEKKHGITWHVIDGGIDTGDILLQDSFNIAPDETTFSLNMKCYASAIAIFPKLIQLLQNNAFCRVPQNLAHRTYFGLHQKPVTLGWVDWSNPAEKIAHLIRALDFDDYENRLASAKCLFGQQVIVIKKISVLLTSSSQPPGTILHFDNNSMTISTQTTDVILSELHSLYGEVLNVPQCCKKNHLGIGSVLASNFFDKNNFNETILRQISQNEAFWVTQYKNTEETNIPFLLSMNANNPLLKLNDFTLSPILLAKLNNICHGENNFALVSATLLFIYLVRINNKNMGSTYIGTDLCDDPLDWPPSFSTHTPLTISFSENTTFSEAHNELKSSITRLKKHGRFFNDLYLRYPTLKNGLRLPLAIIIGDSIDSYNNLPNLVFLISDTKKQVDIFFQTGAIEEYTEIFLNSMSSHIKTLMQGICKAPNMSIYQLPLLTKKEIKLLTIEWNKTKTNYPRTSSLQQLFENQARLNPDKIVACLEDVFISYKELNERSNQLAYYIQGLGLQPYDHVCILLERSFELIITILAILKAGGVYVPIDPEQPQHRILHIIDDCKPKLFISLTLLTEQMLSFPSDLKTVLLDKNNQIIQNHSKINLPFSKNFPLIANIMYTSGSTGKPKGIEITHRGIVRLVKNTNFVGIKNNDCIALLANPMFDAFTFELWGALLNGASLFIITKEVVANPQLFQSTLLNHNVSILLLTSAFFDLITQIAMQSLEKIHTLIVVGDVLSTNSVRKTLKHYPIRIINGYGPTENTGATTYYEINALSTDKYLRTIPIGKPVSNSTVYICDKNLQLLPIGATGELLTGGDGLANAYLNNPELTKKSFIKNPFNTRYPFLYKTGDLVRWLPSGNIEYVGRYDSLIKIRGFRVDLSEIEQVLLKHAKIVGAIVSVNKSATTKQKLIAFIILKKDTQLDTSAISHYLSLHLPSYMIPSSYLFLDKFPLSLNGKIDKEKLFTNLPLRDSKKNKRTDTAYRITVFSCKNLASYF